MISMTRSRRAARPAGKLRKSATTYRTVELGSAAGRAGWPCRRCRAGGVEAEGGDDSGSAPRAQPMTTARWAAPEASCGRPSERAADQAAAFPRDRHLPRAPSAYRRSNQRSGSPAATDAMLACFLFLFQGALGGFRSLGSGSRGPAQIAYLPGSTGPPGRPMSRRLGGPPGPASITSRTSPGRSHAELGNDPGRTGLCLMVPRRRAGDVHDYVRTIICPACSRISPVSRLALRAWQADGDTLSDRSARRTGRRCGQTAATHTGISAAAPDWLDLPGPVPDQIIETLIDSRARSIGS